MGVFCSALANSTLSAFKKKKPAPAPAAAATPATGSAGTASDPNALMVTTKQMTNFSQEAAPASAFEIPAGFKQVQQTGLF